jgi:2-polyprenyl-6-methoxyphenol hydroxylase-like FAD-dependent oxidoreductase
MTGDVEVLIAGAGPTGLTLALWLSHLGVKLRIVDRIPKQASTSRALAVHARTLELHDQVGLAEAAVAAGLEFGAVRLWARGAERARAAFGEMGAGLSPFPFVLILPQDAHEQLLIDTLAARGITVERPVDLRDFQAGQDGVSVRLGHNGGGEERVEAAFLAGCDGAHSTVRATLAEGFPGGTYSRMFYVADVEAAGPVINGDLNICLDEGDFLAVFPLKGAGRARLVGDLEHVGGEALTFDDVGHTVIDRLGVEIKRVNWFSTYRVHHRVAGVWRRGPIFLLGDAAHIHSPVGGQGMNTGMGDAVNLAWKLAAVLRGQAPDPLLDTFERERIAFARRLVATTDRVFQAVSRDDAPARFLRLNVVPNVLPVLARSNAFKRRIFEMVSQTGIHYRGRGLAEGAAGDVHGGDRLPWAEGTDNFAPLKSLAWTAQVHGEPEAGVAEACSAAGVSLSVYPWSEAAGRAGFQSGAFHLVRPDGYVALATHRGAPGALAAFLSKRGLTPAAPR